MKKLISIVAIVVFVSCGGGVGDRAVSSQPGDVAQPVVVKGVSATFAFPTNRGPGAHCELPPGVNPKDAQQAYEHWKKVLVTTDGANGFRRVVRPDTPDGKANSTVSEGISYGMILSVYFDDQALFDDLFRYNLHWADATGLMNWYINPEGTMACPGRDSCGAATDSDEDMAFALVMADYQWDDGGALDNTYEYYAKRQIGLVKKYEVDESGILKPGNQWGGPELLNISYFAPAFYEIFGRYTNDEEYWRNVIDVNYKALFASLNEANKNADNGLVPAWSNQNGEPVVAFDGAPQHYQTDSARTPFRIAQHYCWTGDERARTYLEKVNGFFVPQGADKLSDEYELDGTPRPTAAEEASSMSAVIVGTVAVAAMIDPVNHPFTQQGYDLVKTRKLIARSTYYQLSWTAMILAFMTGNYFDMSTETPGEN